MEDEGRTKPKARNRPDTSTRGDGDGDAETRRDEVEIADTVAPADAGVGDGVTAVDATLPAEAWAVTIGADATLPAEDRDGGTEPTATLTSEAPGRYRMPPNKVAAEIGRGGIGRVLLAEDQHLGRQIAVKELLEDVEPHGYSATPPTRVTPMAARFLREGRITAQLEHPNIVPVYELGQRDNGSLYYTMKLVRGETMAKRLRKAKTLQERLELLPHYLDLCQAIAYAHSRGVIHRDIKTDNVMLGEFGETVVLDWGLAKVKGEEDLRQDDLARGIKLMEEAEAGATVHGSALGTPAYMSPEQASGRLDLVNEQSDVWSLGAVLYEILTGRPPFVGRSARTVIEKVRTDTVQPARELDPAVPPDLAAISAAALRRVQKERYAGAKELAKEVQSYLSGARVAAYEYSSWELVKKFVAQNKAISLLALVVLLAATAIVVTYLKQRATAKELRKTEGRLTDESRAADDNYDNRKHADAARHTLTAAAWLRKHDFTRALAYSTLAMRVHGTGEYYRIKPGEVPRRRRRHLFKTHSVLYEARARNVLALRHGFDARYIDGTSDRKKHILVGLSSTHDGGGLSALYDDGVVLRWKLTIGRLAIPLKRFTLSESGSRPDEPYRRDSVCFEFIDEGKLLLLAPLGRTVVLIRNDRTGNSAKYVLPKNWKATVAIAPDPLQHTFAVAGVAISGADKQRLTSVLGLFDARSGRLVWEKTLPSGTSSAMRIAKLAIEPGGTRILAIDDKGGISVFDRKTGKAMKTLPGADARAVAFLKAGSRSLLVVNRRGEMMRLDLATGRAARADTGRHRSALSSLRVSRTAGLAVTADSDGAVHLWNTEGPSLVATHHYHLGAAAGARLVAGGRHLISHDEIGSIFVFRIDREKARRLSRIWVVYDHAGRVVAKLSRNGITFAKSRSTEALTQGRKDVTAFESSPDGRYVALATRGVGGVVKIGVWRTDTGKRLDLGTVRTAYGRLSFSSDGRYLAAPHGAELRVFNTATGKVVHTLRGHKGAVTSVGYSKKHGGFYTTSTDRTAQLWDIESVPISPQLLSRSSLSLHSARIMKGRRLVAVGTAEGVKVGEIGKSTGLGSVSRYQITDIAYDGKRRLLAGCDTSGRVTVIDAQYDSISRSSPVLSFNAHGAPGDCHLRFISGKRALAVTFDGRTRVWPISFHSWTQRLEEIQRATKDVTGYYVSEVQIELQIKGSKKMSLE